MWAPVWQICLLSVALLAQVSHGLGCPKQCETCSETAVECPQFTAKHTKEHLEVRCTGWNAYDFDDINAEGVIALRPFSQLTFANCAIPRNRSLADTLSFLGPLSNVTRLFFLNNSKNTRSAPLASILFQGLSSLNILSLKFATRHPITSPDLFDQIPQLGWLDLREYGERSLPSGLFNPLQALETLEIRQNARLEELPIGLIADLPRLAKVCIFGNGLKRMERFTGLPRLTHVDLSGNELAELAVDMFSELPQLTGLQLTRNRLTALPEHLFQRNTALQQLDVSNQKGTGLGMIPAGLLAGLTQLTELDFSRNGLQALPDALLRDQRDLRVLKLSHNQLDSLNEQLLQKLTALEQLRLDHNRLRVIDLNAFNGQERSLRTLSLDHNNISLYEQGVEVIYVEGRAAMAQQTPFRSLMRLGELDLSHNAIVKMFVDFSLFMPALTKLNLSHNGITRLEYDQLHFASNKLEQLDLSDNQIQEIQFPAKPRQNERLPAKIILNGNPFRCDCNAHAFVHHVQNASPVLSAASSGPAFSARRFTMDRLACDGPPELQGKLVRDVSPLALVCELRSDVCPTECACQIRPEDLTVVLDCASRNLTTVPALSSPTTIGYRYFELLLQGNQLQQLPTASEDAPVYVNASGAHGWEVVRRLNVSSNRLSSLLRSNLPPLLEMLDVSDNRLHAMDADLAKTLADRTEQTLRNISLAGNPWTCACESELLLFAQDNVRHIDDFRSLRCADGQSITAGMLGELCGAKSQLIVAFCVAVATVACVVVLLAFLYQRYQHEVKVWLFTHNLLQWLASEEDLDRDKQYDAFVSYSHKDEAFITEHLVPTLERAPMNFRVCWHVRDFMPGEMISAQITKAVEESRRTIIVLSANYLESVWGQMEFKTAYLQSIEDKRNRVIAIIYDNIGNVEELDPELRAYLKTNTYLRWGDPWFWDKLRYAMPHPIQIKGKQATSNMRMASMDKLNLLKPVPNGDISKGNPADVPLPESTPPIQQVAKAAVGSSNLYAPPQMTPPFTISTGKLQLQMPV